MKKLALSLYFISSSALACNFSSLGVELPNLVTDLNPKDCVSEQETIFPAFYDWEIAEQLHCECILEQNEKFEESLTEDHKNQIKKKFISELLGKNEKALYQLTERLSVLDHPMFPENTADGIYCREQLKDQLSQLSCPGNNTILNEAEINNYAKSIYEKAEQELLAKRGNQPSSLIERDSQKFCDDTTSSKELFDLQTSFSSLYIPVLSDLLKQFPDDILDSINSWEDIHKVRVSIDQTDKNQQVDELRLNLNNYTRDLNQHPFLQTIIQDPQFFNELKSGSLTELSHSELMNRLNSIATANVRKQCESVKQNTIDILCTTNEDNIIPNDFEEYGKHVRDMQDLEEIPSALISNEFSKSFCASNSQDSKFNALEDAIYSNYKNMDDYDAYSPLRDYRTSVASRAPLICPYVPPVGEKKEALVNKKAECDLEANKLKYECLYVQGLHARFAGQINALVADEEARIKKEAPNIADELLTERLNTYRETLTATDLMPEQNEPSKIVAAFLGETTLEEVEQTQELAQQEDSNNTQRGNSSTSNTRGNALGNLANPNQVTQARGNQTTSSRGNSTSPRVDQNMDNFYDEIRRRIEEERENSNTPVGQIPDYLRPALDVPAPAQSRRPSGFDQAPVQVAAAGSNINFTNFVDDGNQVYPGDFSSGDYQTNDTTPTREEEYNQALLAANRGKVSGSTGGRSLGSAPISISGFSSTGDGLATDIPEIAISSNLDQDLEEMVKGGYDQAEQLLELLQSDKRSIVITHKDHPDYRVQVIRNDDGFEVVATENQADSGYMDFVNSIRRSLNIQDQFEGLIARLNVIVNGANEKGSTQRAFDSFNSLFN